MTASRRTRLFVGLAVFAGLALLAAANTHLVYVSFTSQPDCVSHLKAPGAPGTFRAAESSC